MIDGKGRLHQRVFQIVRIIAGHLVGREHALVDQGATGKAWEIEEVLVVAAAIAHGLFKDFTKHEKLALKPVGVVSKRRFNVGMINHGLDGSGCYTESRVVGFELAPAQEVQPFLTDKLLEHGLTGHAGIFLWRAEKGAYAVLSGAGQFNPFCLAAGPHEGMRNLDQDAGTVACGCIGTHSAPVIEIDQRLNSIANNLVIFASLEIHNKTDTTGIMFESWVI